jgi:hypothetical protein
MTGGHCNDQGMEIPGAPHDFSGCGGCRHCLRCMGRHCQRPEPEVPVRCRRSGFSSTSHGLKPLAIRIPIGSASQSIRRSPSCLQLSRRLCPKTRPTDQTPIRVSTSFHAWGLTASGRQVPPEPQALLRRRHREGHSVGHHRHRQSCASEDRHSRARQYRRISGLPHLSGKYDGDRWACLDANIQDSKVYVYRAADLEGAHPMPVQVFDATTDGISFPHFLMQRPGTPCG